MHLGDVTGWLAGIILAAVVFAALVLILTPFAI